MLPEVTAATLIYTVAGEHTAEGSVICNTGAEGYVKVIEPESVPVHPERSNTKEE